MKLVGYSKATGSVLVYNLCRRIFLQPDIVKLKEYQVVKEYESSLCTRSLLLLICFQGKVRTRTYRFGNILQKECIEDSWVRFECEKS